MSPDDPLYTEWLRDQFALAALQGVLACPDTMSSMQGLVDHAWRIADMCLEKRNEQPA
jgi:hypothetical protein